MKKQIVNVSAMQAGKVMGVLYFICSFPFILLMGIGVMSNEQEFPGLMLILLPFLYAFFGFLFTVIGAAIYNLVAARMGGFEFTTVEVADRA